MFLKSFSIILLYSAFKALSIASFSLLIFLFNRVMGDLNKSTKTVSKKSEKTKNKKPNTKSKKQNKPTFLMLDKIADVKARYKKRKTIRQNLKKLNRKKIIFYLARRNIVEWNSNAPLKVLKDLYLAATSMGDVYVQKM